MRRLFGRALGLALLAFASSAHADYFGSYLEQFPDPLTVVIDGDGDAQISWEIGDPVCKYQIFKNGVKLTNRLKPPRDSWEDPDYATGDVYELKLYACRNHVHMELSDPVSPAPLLTKEELLSNRDVTGAEDVRPGVFAVPGAVGPAGQSIGGRFGQPFIVNTLQDVVAANDGLISYREVMEGVGDVPKLPRVLLFGISGIIDTGVNSVTNTDGRISIYCQSAPSPGVVIVGYRPMSFSGPGADDIIVQHCDVKTRDTLSNLNDTQRNINIGAGVDRAYFQNISALWSTDDSFSVFISSSSAGPAPNDITLAHSIVGEGDTTCQRADFECGTPQGQGSQGNYSFPNHSMGPLIASQNGSSVTGVTVLGNVFINTNARNPWLSGVSLGVIKNNIIGNPYGQGLQDASFNSTPRSIYALGNIIKLGPDSQVGNSFIAMGTNTNQNMIDDNVRINYDGTVITDYLDNGATPPINGGPDHATDGNILLNLQCVGAAKPFRDSSDTRLLEELNGTGPDPMLSSAEVGIGPRIAPIVPPCSPGQSCFYEPTILTQGQRNYIDYAGSNSHPSDYDTDGDGMADWWERMVADSDLNDGIETIEDIDHLTDCDNDGRSDLEEFQSRLARCDLP